MKAVKLLFSVCFFGLLCLAIGCTEKEVFKPLDETEHDVANIKGIVSFQSHASFAKAYTSFANKDDDYWENTIPKMFGHVSSLQVLKQFEDLVDDENTSLDKAISYLETYPNAIYLAADSTVETIIEDPILSALINDAGLLLIGDTLYQFSRNELKGLVFDPHHESVLDALDKFKNSSEDIVVHPILREEAAYKYEKLGGSRSCRPKKCKDYYSRKRRMKGAIWKINIWFIKGTGAQTKSQRKKWFFWVGKKVTRVKVQVTPEGYSTKRRHRSNKKKVNILVAFYVWGGNNVKDNPTPDFKTQLRGVHRLLTNGNGNGSCTTCRK